jgi:protein-disulfide isomerase
MLAAPLVLAQQPNPKVIGSPTAPVAMDVFSDFECPHCGHLHDGALKMIIANEVAKGRVRVILHDYPLPQHKFAPDAARYSIAAGRLGAAQYQKVSDMLFAAQGEWGTGGTKQGDVDEVVARVLTPAEMVKVRKAIKDPAIDAELKHDKEAGDQIPLRETPTMLFKSKGKTYPVSGAVSYDILKKLIDSI